MNNRKSLMITAVWVLLLSALLVPMTSILSSGRDTALDQKQMAVARALEMEREREALPAPSPVQAAPEMEAIWAIEDARTETEAQLVDTMFRGGDVLGYDAESRTFYCTLGMETGDTWPEIALSVRGAEGVQALWVDDYSYDWCFEAIAEGYRYELLAYTASEYAYIGVVFTGLPVVTLHAEGEITMDSDVPGHATIAAAGFEPINTAMVVHERGGGCRKPFDKWSYRVEFHEISSSGKDRSRDVSVLGMKADSDWLLLANTGEDTTVRNLIAWELWRDWHQGEPGLMLMDSEMVELFINDEYVGVYQLMERIDEAQEIAQYGGNVNTDVVGRLVSTSNMSEKPIWDMNDEGVEFRMEYRYEPRGDSERLFGLMEDFVALYRPDDKKLDDEAFAALALERVDIEDMMTYILFYHATTLNDNNINNVFVYAMQEEDGRYVYRHAPWDMDSSFWVQRHFQDHNTLRWPDLTVMIPTRMLDLDVGGCRRILWEMWNEKRRTVLSSSSLYARFMEKEEFMNRSGAYRREMRKWYGTDKALDMSEVAYYTEECLNLVRLTMLERWPVPGMQLEQ